MLHSNNWHNKRNAMKQWEELEMWVKKISKKRLKISWN